MKARWLAVALALCALVPGVSFAASSAQDGNKVKTQQGDLIGTVSSLGDSELVVPRSDPTTRALRVSNDRPIQDQNVVFEGIIDDTTMAHMADSSAVIDVHALRHLRLLIKATIPDSLANPSVRLAISIRDHLNGQSDSSSTFPIPTRPKNGTLLSTSLADTVLTYGGVEVPTTAQPAPYEFIVELTQESAVASKWASPPSISIALEDVFGAGFWTDYISVRIRMLHHGDQTPTEASRVTVHLKGTPL